MVRGPIRLTGILLLIVVNGFSIQTPRDQRLDWFNQFFLEEKGDTEKMIRTVQATLDQALTNNDRSTVARCYKELGLINLTRINDLDRAMDLFLKALTIEDSLGYEEEQVITYMAMSRTFEQVSDYEKSRQFLEQAMAINERHRDPYILIFILNDLGKINAAQGRLDAAFDNYELVLEYARELDQPQLEATALFNLAHLHTIQGKYNEALTIHRQSLALRRSLNDAWGEATSLNDIGELYRLMGNHERALANHKVALEIRQRQKDKNGLAQSYNTIGALYFQQREPDRAIANLQLGLQAAQEADAQEEMRRSFELLSQCYEQKGLFAEALHYKNKLVSIMEFIFHESSERQLLETQNRYVVDQYEADIERLEALRSQRERELEAQRRFNRLLIIMLAGAGIMGSVIVYLHLGLRKSNNRLVLANNQIEKQNTELQELNATKDKFFSIISHDLKGPLNSLTSFSNLLINHTDSLSKEEIQMLAKDLDKNLKNLFALLENLLEWSRSQTGNIDFTPEEIDLHGIIRENAELLQAQAQNKRITILYEAGQPLIVSAHKHSVTTVIRNLISNAIKFTPEGGTIMLKTTTGVNEVTVSVADTGVGMTEAVMKKLFRLDTKHSTKGTADEKGTGLGLILCKDFVEKNGGRIWVESELEKGSVFYFTLPLTLN